MSNTDLLDFIKEIESDKDIQLLAKINDFINNENKDHKIKEIAECLNMITKHGSFECCDSVSYQEFIEINMIVIEFLQCIK